MNEKFPKVQKVQCSLFLGGVWPALLIDGKITINLITQMYFDYEAFKGIKDKMPAELAVQLDEFYNMDWINFDITPTVTNINIESVVKKMKIVS